MKKTVLVVDDAPDSRLLMNRLLTGLGCEVILAEGGEAALQIAQTNALSGILVDINMPGLDGWQTATELRTLGVACPMVALSGDASPDDVTKSLSVGMNDHWVKPVKKAQLQSWIVGLSEVEGKA